MSKGVRGGGGHACWQCIIILPLRVLLCHVVPHAIAANDHHVPSEYVHLLHSQVASIEHCGRRIRHARHQQELTRRPLAMAPCASDVGAL